MHIIVIMWVTQAKPHAPCHMHLKPHAPCCHNMLNDFLVLGALEGYEKLTNVLLHIAFPRRS